MTESIVVAACERYRVKPEDLFAGKRGKKLTKARVLAIAKLREAGFSGKGIARMLRCNYSTIQYWTHASYRQQRSMYYRRLNAERKQNCSSIGAHHPPSLNATQ